MGKKEEKEFKRMLYDDFYGPCPRFWKILGKKLGLKGKKLKEFYGAK